MKYTIENHRLMQDGKMVAQKPSPNHGGQIVPELVVIHYTGDHGTGGLNWLTQKGSGVSAHLWISKKGEVIQLLPFNVCAWHAGKSEYDGRPGCNNFSIGIENQGVGNFWPDEQIEANRAIIEALSEAYQIEDIVGHEDVAIPAGRKVDPGQNYPWEKVVEL